MASAAQNARLPPVLRAQHGDFIFSKFFSGSCNFSPRCAALDFLVVAVLRIHF
jgi:hypothetical protein